jgi:hypothetical protein
MTTNNKPIETIKCNAVKAAIWANETDKGIKYTVTFSRLYQKDDQWKSSTTFGEDDLSSLYMVAHMAYSMITARKIGKAPPNNVHAGQIFG